jgi:hypothetical protein
MEDLIDARLNDEDASRELQAYLPEHMSCHVWAVIRIEGGYRVMRRVEFRAEQWLTDTMAGRIASDVP